MYKLSNEQMQSRNYAGLFSDVYLFLQSFGNTCDNVDYWEDVLKKAYETERKFRENNLSEFATALLVACINELERVQKKKGA